MTPSVAGLRNLHLMKPSHRPVLMIGRNRNLAKLTRVHRDAGLLALVPQRPTAQVAPKAGCQHGRVIEERDVPERSLVRPAGDDGPAGDVDHD